MTCRRPSVPLHRDAETIRRFASDPAATFLVSFPRTGSRWLRMLMELYFRRPTLTRVFYWPGRTDYLLLHSHDLDLSLMRSNVIYLYREPVATVYSQLLFHRERTTDRDRIRHWSELYGRHLERWLHLDRWTTRKTTLTYDGMKVDLDTAFARVCAHYGEALDPSRLRAAAARVTRAEIRDKVPDDPRVIAEGDRYEAGRAEFRERCGAQVWTALLGGRPQLESNFAPQRDGVT